jgi:hypothetical protein
MEYTGPIKQEAIRAVLRAAFSAKDSATHILFDGSVIGQMVARPEPGSRRTVYVGRVVWQDRPMEVEAASSSRLLNRVASVIAESLAVCVSKLSEMEPE